MAIWNLPNRDLADLTIGQEHVVIERYSERRNGFEAKRRIQAQFANRRTTIEITDDTRVHFSNTVPPETCTAAGFESVEKLEELLQIDNKTLIAVVRFKIARVLDE